MTAEAIGLSKWFGQKVALSDVSVSFGPGVTGLLGPNGAGKTTLLRVLSGLQVPSQGEVRLLGVDPRRDRSVYSTVAMVPEDEAVYPDLSAREFIRLRARLAGVAEFPDRFRLDRSGVEEDGRTFVAVHTHSDTLRILELLNLRERIRLFASSFLALPAIVRATDLGVIMPGHVAREIAAAGDLAVVEPQLPLRDFTVSLHWSRRQQSDPAHRWMRELIAELFHVN